MKMKLQNWGVGSVLLLMGGCYLQAPPQTAANTANAHSGQQEVVVVEQQQPAQPAQPQVVVVEPQQPATPPPQVVVVEQPAQPAPPPQVVVTQPTAPPPPQVLSSNFGTVALQPGFMPDPHVVTGTSGGPLAANQIAGQHCRGFITQQPDHIFVAQGGYRMLKILANSPQDTTLIVRQPNGQYLCNDDGGQGLNPMIQGSFGAGTYMIWVGSYRRNVRAPYRLGFTELAHVNTQSIGAAGPPAPQVQVATPNVGPSNFGTVALRAGFMPDPHVVRGVSGGNMPAQNMNGSCRGYITQRPDHVFVAQTHFNELRVMARSRQDTTLVIQGPDGRVFCNDDGGGRNGLNPMVVLRPMQAGAYRVWVGSYQRNVNARYSLGFSELNVDTNRLPMP